MADDPKLDLLRRKIRRARKDERLHTRKAHLYQRKIAFLRRRITVAVARRKGLEAVAILDRVPVTLEQKIALLWARQHGWVGRLNSGDRRDIPRVARILHRFGLHTQAELYQMYLNGTGAPANPPNKGTHMRLGDGTLGAPSEPLPAYEQGIDSSDATNLRNILRSGGFTVQQTYGNEEWHTNWTAPIKPVLVKLGLV